MRACVCACIRVCVRGGHRDHGKAHLTSKERRLTRGCPWGAPLGVCMCVRVYVCVLSVESVGRPTAIRRASLNPCVSMCVGGDHETVGRPDRHPKGAALLEGAPWAPHTPRPGPPRVLSLRRIRFGPAWLPPLSQMTSPEVVAPPRMSRTLVLQTLGLGPEYRCPMSHLGWRTQLTVRGRGGSVQTVAGRPAVAVRSGFSGVSVWTRCFGAPTEVVVKP